MSRRRRSPAAQAPADFDEADAALSEDLQLLEDAAPHYLAWLEALCLPYLGDRCLELGSGHGYLTERLAEGRTVVASDISDTALAFLKTRFGGSDNVEVRRINISEFEPTDQFDAIVMLNVLEHVEDDTAALITLRKALVPGGRLIVYVPAFMLLYSEQDRAIGHFRRYKKKPLRKLLQATGYEVIESRYVNSLGAIGWFIHCRLLGRKSSAKLAVNACDRVVVPIVRSCERMIAPPFGLSVFVVGRPI